MSLAKFSVNQAVFVNLLFLVFIVAGAVVYRLLPVDVYPDLSLDEAWIQTPYPGASPELVEQHVTKQIEEKLEGIPGVSYLASNSEPNISRIFVKFDENLNRIDYEAAFQEVRNRLDQATDLPAEAEEPQLTRLTVGEVWPIVQVVIADEGVGDERVVREVARDLKVRLRAIEGISKIREVGLRDREIHVLVDKHALEQYGLSLQEVAGILKSSNQNIPGGNVLTAAEELVLVAEGNASTPEELGDICIKKSPTGDHVYLREIATIQQDFERRLTISRYMGKPCAFLYVAKKRSADSVTVRNRVEEALGEYRADLPPGVSVELFADSTLMISSRLNILKRNLAFGLVLVFTVLWMIVGFRNSILAVVGIPFSFLCAFIFMYAIDVSINAVSVFALVLVSGMVVDDAIVVLENIYRHVQNGEPLKQAIIDGTSEVTWPVVSSALTTVAAFMPLLIMSGMIGRFFAIIPKTVTVALLASLFECLLILPSHYLHWGPRTPKTTQGSRGHRRQPLFGRLGTNALQSYRQVVEQAIAHRYLCLGVLTVLGACAYQAQRTLAVELFPSDFPTLVVTFEVDPKANLEETDRVCQTMLPVFADLAEKNYAKTYSSNVGVQWNKDNQMLQRSNLAQIWSELHQTGRGDYDPTEVIVETRRRLLDFAQAHPELNIRNLEVWPIQDGPPIGKPVAIRVEHPNYEVAKGIADRVKHRLQQMAGVFDIADNLHVGQGELRMVLKEAEASEFGLTFEDVFSTISGANEGFAVGTFKDPEYDEDLDIRVKYRQEFRSHEDQLLDVDIKSPVTHALIKLSQVADLRYEQGYANHYRYDGRRAVLITADVDTRITDSQRVNETILGEFSDLAAHDDQLSIVAGGQFKETRESFNSLKSAAMIAICVMYLILAAQFKSYLQPLIVLTSLVFGVMGVIMGLVIHGYPFSVITGIAMVGLFGVMVNDAILLVSFANTERARTSSVKQALVDACLIRARPIILTTVTTVAGLLPMALGVGGYNKIWSPFATCICWGLTSATVLILVLLPAFYFIVEDAKAVAGRMSRKAAPGRTLSAGVQPTESWNA